jgi:transposase InsO family protein
MRVRVFAGILSPEEKRRLKVMDYYQRMGQKNVRKICRYFGIHHSSFYRWKAKYNPWKLESLKSKKRGPKKGRQIPWELVVKICSWKKDNPSKGAEYLWEELTRKEGKPLCSSRTIYRWWKRRGLIQLMRKRPRRKLPLVVNVSSPGELIQLDTKHLPGKRYQYTAIDKYSRWRFLKVYPSFNLKNSQDFLSHLLGTIPFRVKLIQTDNGPEFQKEFISCLTSLGISHQYIWIHTPDQNGCVERSHRTDEDEFYTKIDLRSLSLGELNILVENWVRYYNEERLHYALGWKTPMEFLTTKVSQN